MPQKTTNVIISTGNNYLLGVKKNQKKLFNQIVSLTAEQKNISSRFIELIKNKGRIERREVFVSDCIEAINKDWVGLKQVIKVYRRIKEKGRIRQDDAFFISSMDVNAQVFCHGIKSHWAIENGLHWVKDVTFREDASRIRTANAPQNVSVFRNIAINIFRMNDYENLAQAQRLVSNDIGKLNQLII